MKATVEQRINQSLARPGSPVAKALEPYSVRARCPGCGHKATNLVRQVKGDRSTPLVCRDCAE